MISHSSGDFNDKNIPNHCLGIFRNHDILVIKIPLRVSDHETLACRDKSVVFSFFNINIMLYFNVLSTVLWKNLRTDFLVTYIHTYISCKSILIDPSWGFSRPVEETNDETNNANEHNMAEKSN